MCVVVVVLFEGEPRGATVGRITSTAAPSGPQTAGVRRARPDLDQLYMGELFVWTEWGFFSFFPFCSVSSWRTFFFFFLFFFFISFARSLSEKYPSRCRRGAKIESSSLERNWWWRCWLLDKTSTAVFVDIQLLLLLLLLALLMSFYQFSHKTIDRDIRRMCMMRAAAKKKSKKWLKGKNYLFLFFSHSFFSNQYGRRERTSFLFPFPPLP